MKFAKELDQELVPEWRLKYLDYKGGKKRIKEISRALTRINTSPRLGKTPTKSSTRTPFSLFGSGTAGDDGGIRTPPDARETLAEQLLRAQIASQPREQEDSTRTSHRDAPQDSPLDGLPSESTVAEDLGYQRQEEEERSLRRPLERSPGTAGQVNERSPLRSRNQAERATESTSYGSLLTMPVMRASPVGPPSLELPDPAVPPSDPLSRTRLSLHRSGETPQMRRASSVAGDAYEVGRTHTPSKLAVGKLPKKRNIFHPRRIFTTPYGNTNSRRPFFNRMLTSSKPETPMNPDAPVEAYREFDLAQARFFNFLDKELEKIDSFYKMKEEESADRLEKLHQQLRIMRDRRVHELLAAQQLERQREEGRAQENGHRKRSALAPLQGGTLEAGRELIRPIEQVVGFNSNHVGKNSKALQDMVAAKQRGEDPNDPPGQGWRDYSRHPVVEEVPYRVAKRKLKLALQEYYRGLELLRSYALLNLTALRKINKKYDKAVMARPPYRFMSERVNKSWFVVSERLERMIVECEDLYSRYFERGNHKVAVKKLRSKIGKTGFSSSVFRNGMMLAAGVILGTQGTVNGFYVNSDPSDPTRGLYASYLLQLYGGYALALLLFLLFSFDCRQWTFSKINYVFIFEFDTRDNLDWRQLAELPCLFALLLGLTMFLNFYPTVPPDFFLWWPVLLISLTVIILFFPFRLFYWRSRGWFLYSLWRLVFAGIYAVEFRDFFLGDMFCSLTYSMGNIEVFFCLYGTDWSNPGMCNSSSSRLLGFFSTLPGIWRALQCVRRYYDTRNVFPHLVNCGKYACTILFYMSLSLYRIHRTRELYVLFVLFGTLNSIYVSIWDLVMDWSLCNPYAPNPMLRKDLGFKSVRFYYTAMIIDPILRFNWLMYIILPVELQHSALLSFLISVSEVIRRAMWTLIRVENEHCTNVGRFRASRDVPLPYELGDEISDMVPYQDQVQQAASTPATVAASTRTAEDQPPQSANALQSVSTATSYPSPQTLRRRQTLPPGVLEATGLQSPRRLNRVGTMLTTAHAQDFERRKKPGGTFVRLNGASEPNDAKAPAEEPMSSDEEEEEPAAEGARLMGAREQESRLQEARRDVPPTLGYEDIGDPEEEAPGDSRSRAEGKARET